MLLLQERVECPGCRDKRSREIYRCGLGKIPLVDYLTKSYGQELLSRVQHEEYLLKECLLCGLLFQARILMAAGMKELYEKWTGNKTAPQRLDLSKEVEIVQEVLTLIASFNKPANELTFLDYGMGNGEWVAIASALGCQAHGYDLSKERKKEASLKKISILEEKQLAEYTFDFINTEQVMEHVSHPLETLLRLKTLLKPQGVIKISVPNGRNIKRKLKSGDWMARKGSKKDLNPIAPLEHINCFTYHSLQHMASLAGLKPFKLPLHLQYHYSLRWNTFKWLRKNLLKPLKRNYTTRGTYLFFTKDTP